MKKFILIIIATVLAVQANADVLTDFDGLGDNKELMDKAKALNPEVKVNVVQDRTINRRNRFEIPLEFQKVTGGDSYISTYGYGAGVNYHITPRWSVGAKYTYYTNELTDEGKNLANSTNSNGEATPADIDSPKSSYMGLVNWYPIYGKVNWFNRSITHFDMYATAGYGNITLFKGGGLQSKGTTQTWMAGLGVGLWFSQHLTGRAEVRYQSYQALRNNQDNTINTVIASFQVGYLL